MTILFDHQAFDMQRYGGVSNCFVQLISRLPDYVHYRLSLEETDNVHLQESGIVDVGPARDPSNRFIINRHFLGQGKLYMWYAKRFPSRTTYGRNRLRSIADLEQGHFDVFHPTFFDDYFLSHLNGKPFVLTVHDMIPELFYRPNDWQIINKKRLVKEASHLIAISEKTKEDLVQMLHVPEDKISVIYHGAPDVYLETGAPLIDKKYILYVGDRVGYKSFMPMLKSLVPILTQRRDLHIVCTGKDFTKDERKAFRDFNIQEQLIHVRPDDQGMMNLYAYAQCFIYPSQYEGFGIPILEAYQAHCPVLLNQKSCFPEIAQDAAVYFDLDDQHSDLTEVMTHFLSQSREERGQLLQRQQQRLSYFSWEKSARQLTQVYESVLS